MNDSVLKYKDYTAKIEYSAEDKVLHGVIDGIDDLVDFYSDSANEIVNEFHAAVDAYLELCENIGKEPNKAYTGTFNIRIRPELHRKMTIMAKHNGNSLNAEVEKAIQLYIDDIESFEQSSNRVMIVPNQNVKQSTVSYASNNTEWEDISRHGSTFQTRSSMANPLN